MRSFLALLVGMVALGGVAQAQILSASDPTGRGYVEGVAQSAFGNVTSQSFGGELGVTILPNTEVFLEVGRVNDVATAQLGAAAQTIGAYLSQTQANVTYNVKEPATFGVVGAKYVMPMTGKVRPYALAGGGVAKVSRNVTFAVGGTDATANLAQAPYFVQLGSDLAGSFSKPMLVVGGGVLWPAWQRLVVDFQYRYGRIYADAGGINMNRAGVGIGVRF